MGTQGDEKGDEKSDEKSDEKGDGKSDELIAQWEPGLRAFFVMHQLFINITQPLSDEKNYDRSESRNDRAKLIMNGHCDRRIYERYFKPWKMIYFQDVNS